MNINFEPFVSQEFLHQEVCQRVEGAREEIEKVKVYYDRNRHLGLGKIAFASVQIAQKCAKELNNVSIMGSKIGAVIDPRADKLKQFQECQNVFLIYKTLKLVWPINTPCATIL